MRHIRLLFVSFLYYRKLRHQSSPWEISNGTDKRNIQFKMGRNIHIDIMPHKTGNSTLLGAISRTIDFLLFSFLLSAYSAFVKVILSVAFAGSFVYVFPSLSFQVPSGKFGTTSPVFFGVRIMVNFVQFPNILAI